MSRSLQLHSSPQDDGGWQPASTAPFDRDLELAVIDDDGIHALVFPAVGFLRVG